MTLKLVICQMFCVSVPLYNRISQTITNMYKDVVLYNLTRREVPVTVEYSEKDN
jgi:hypothetical protein